MRKLVMHMHMWIEEDGRREEPFIRKAVHSYNTLAAAGKETTVPEQADDEFHVTDQARRMAREAYRDLAAALGIRRGPGWSL